MEKFVSMFKDGLKYGKKRYKANMKRANGEMFDVSVWAYNTAQAIVRVKDIAEKGSQLMNIEVEDMYDK